jgi:hypothetical protein
MKPWTKEGLSAAPLDAKDSHTDSYYQYELRGVLVHSGGADAGHYYSYIKERIPRFGKEPLWFEFNDKVVSLFDPKDLATECFGGIQMVTHWDNWQRQYVRKPYDRVRNAYMLIYERMAPDAADASSKEVLQTITDLSAKRADLINGIPAAIYRSVWEENSSFLRDRKLFDPTYFEFMLNFSKLANFAAVPQYDVDPVSLADEASFQHIKFSTHFVIDTLAHAKEADNFKLWIDQLKLLYMRHIPACKWLLQYLLDSGLIKDLLLECTNEKVRIGIADLMTTVCKYLGPHEYAFWGDIEVITKQSADKREGQEPKLETYKVAKPIVVRFMDGVLSYLEDSRSYWRKFKQYPFSSLFNLLTEKILFGH